MLEITSWLSLPESELEFSAIRAQGAGGQNVNKVSSAIHLRFDIRNSSLPEDIKTAMLGLSDSRITRDGVLVLKAQSFRTQEQNRDDAMQRLVALIQQAMHKPKPRKATRPTRASQRRRVDSKKKQGQQKALRRKPLM